MRKGSSFLPHSSVQLSASAESRQQSVCVCRRAQLFFYLGAKERERKVTRLLTWPLIAGTNSRLLARMELLVVVALPAASFELAPAGDHLLRHRRRQWRDEFIKPN